MNAVDAKREADLLLDIVKTSKRDAHRARRQARSALNKLEQLKRKCAEFKIRLVIDGVVLYTPDTEERIDDHRSPD